VGAFVAVPIWPPGGVLAPRTVDHQTTRVPSRAGRHPSLVVPGPLRSTTAPAYPWPGSLSSGARARPRSAAMLARRRRHQHIDSNERLTLRLILHVCQPGAVKVFQIVHRCMSDKFHVSSVRSHLWKRRAIRPLGHLGELLSPLWCPLGRLTGVVQRQPFVRRHDESAPRRAPGWVYDGASSVWSWRL